MSKNRETIVNKIKVKRLVSAKPYTIKHQQRNLRINDSLKKAFSLLSYSVYRISVSSPILPSINESRSKSGTSFKSLLNDTKERLERQDRGYVEM